MNDKERIINHINDALEIELNLERLIMYIREGQIGDTVSFCKELSYIFSSI